MIIRVANNLDVNASLTYLSVAKSANVGTLNVKNTNAFPANWAVQIGKLVKSDQKLR